MIGHVWTVICSRVLIDRDTNNVTLVEVLEQVTLVASGPPPPESAVPLEMEIVTLWERRDENVPARARARIHLVAPDGKTANPLEYVVDLTTHVRTRSRTQVKGFPFRGFGRYEFRVAVRQDGQEDWQEVSRAPLQVVAATEQADAATGAA